MSTIEIFLYQERPIDPQAVHALYTSVDWWPERTEEQIAQILHNDVAIGAWDADRLVGFARTISDHCVHAYIEDVMVHPSYQQQGVGKLMLTRLIDALSHIDTLTLFCASDLVPFYEGRGFRVFPAQNVLHRKG
jgi:GNAT superfamily N-acetyltransferase